MDSLSPVTFKQSPLIKSSISSLENFFMPKTPSIYALVSPKIVARKESGIISSFTPQAEKIFSIKLIISPLKREIARPENPDGASDIILNNIFERNLFIYIYEYLFIYMKLYYSMYIV
jgi:hypothetical protein